MKSKFTHKEKKAILDRYILKSESPTSIIESVGRTRRVTQYSAAQVATRPTAPFA